MPKSFLAKLKVKDLPKPPIKTSSLFGPSLVMIGLGLGTGELILWPYLVANYGLGIIWGAVVGITMQYFLNMEIERYTLVNGESIFVGFARLYKKLTYWFILSTCVALTWPGFSAAAAKALGPVFGIADTTVINIIMLIIVGTILTLGPILYNTIETFMKIVIGIGIPSIIFLVIASIKFDSLQNLSMGILGIGNNYMFLPEGIPLFTFLAAFAYSGAAGNLNLAQSFYVKEKGYAMGKYAGRVTSLLTGKKEEISLEGTTFKPTKENITKFNKWWKFVNIEHFTVFWGLGIFTIFLLALLSYQTIYNEGIKSTGMEFIYAQADIISIKVGWFFGPLLLIVTALMLFKTQLSVTDAAGRIITDNLAILFKEKKIKTDYSKLYYIIIWVLIMIGIMILMAGFKEPQALIILGAVLNAFCMFVFSGFLIKLNTKFLPNGVKPSKFRRYAVYITFTFFGLLSLFTIIEEIRKILR